MKKRIHVLFLVCAVAIGGVVLLQLAWLKNYYQLSRERFDKEVNLAFEDAVKQEFKVRCDTLEELLLYYVSDTNNVHITSTRRADSFYLQDSASRYVYTIADRKRKNDNYSFGHKLINEPVKKQGDSVAMKVARAFARTYREEDFENHIIFYHTQELGKYIGKKATEYNFDTARLAPIFKKNLAERNIHEPFRFLYRDEDNTLNHNDFPDSLTAQFPVITKAFPTYKVKTGENFVRALFASPKSYMLNRMIWMLAGSFTLILVVGLVLFYLVRIIQREKKLSAIKNDFISNITHELKTPVATVSGVIEAMESFKALEDPRKTKRYLDISKSELNRLSELVNKILYTSLYEKGEFELQMEQFDIDELVNGLVENYTLSMSKKTSISYQNQTGQKYLYADKLHVYNVINNLLDNAIKYSGDEVVIDMEFTREHNYAVITVKDNGIGIARHELPYIFEKFYRVSSGNLHKVKGFGLGLTYVQKIMEKHGGICKADSHPGNGSIFKLVFLHDEFR